LLKICRIQQPPPPHHPLQIKKMYIIIKIIYPPLERDIPYLPARVTPLSHPSSQPHQQS
jgi:hypothetical protein